jgi:hypothetical protein
VTPAEAGGIRDAAPEHSGNLRETVIGVGIRTIELEIAP